MRSEREATRIVQTWLEQGSTALPDRVLDAVLTDLPSTPQRRSRWSPWRFGHMSSFLKLGAVAAGIAIAVIVGVRLLPGVSQDGASGVSASPSLPPGGFGGSVSIPYLQSTASIETLGALDGSTLTGTVLFGHRHGNLSLRLACVHRDGDHWILGGTVDSATTELPLVGAPAALLVIDGPQQRAVVWSPDVAPSGDQLDVRRSGGIPAARPGETCEAFVARLPSSVFDEAQPVHGGTLTLPPAP